MTFYAYFKLKGKVKRISYSSEDSTALKALFISKNATGDWCPAGPKTSPSSP
jgi:hypothetical protein